MGLAVLVTGAGGQPTTQAALEITLLLGSALEEFCNQGVPWFTDRNPQLADGTPLPSRCPTLGSGDVVTLAQ
ncbi:MAG: hypothetical protein Q6K17_00840 [Gloeomargarita sp. GMQP_bins_5]